MDNVASVPIQTQTTPTESTAVLQHTPEVAQKLPDETFTGFQVVNQIPYSAKAFGMTKSQYFALKIADITDLAPKMEAIDSYVRDKIVNERYNDSTTTYDKMLAEIKSSLGIKDYESPSSQIEKIFLYINNGKNMERKFHVKRSSKAEEIDHAKNVALKQLQSKYPNKTSRLASIFNTFINA